MIGLYPLLSDFITRLQADALLETQFGEAVRCYTERPPETVSEPFLTVDMVNASPFADATYAGTDYLIQVAAWFKRGERATTRGVGQVAKSMALIREALADVDAFALSESPVEEASLRFDLEDGAHQVTGNAHRLILRQYVSGQIIPDPSGQYIQGIARFRCLVGTEN